MVLRKRIACCFALLLWAAAILAHYAFAPWNFYWKVSSQEEVSRMQFVETAEDWLGMNEADGSHKTILELYNGHEPLAEGYAIQETDSWCAAFVSAAAIQCSLTDIIPTECSCGRQIELWKEMGCWQEDDTAIPLPGDIIYYDWDQTKPGDSTGWPDHVGIVVGTKWPFVKIIEGNYDDQVKYRIILLGDIRIRGYGMPQYQ